jgi:hypothetical protein
LISIAAAQEAGTSKEIVIDKNVVNVVSRTETGVFTSGLLNALKANIEMIPIELKKKIDADLKKYPQNATTET